MALWLAWRERVFNARVGIFLFLFFHSGEGGVRVGMLGDGRFVTFAGGGLGLIAIP